MKKIMLFIGNFFFRWRDTAFTLIFLTAFAMLILHPEHKVGDFQIEIVATLIGFLFLAAGQFARAITIGLAYIKRGGLNKQIYAETLVRRGMFAHCRNPLYLGNLLIVTGAIFVLNMPLYYLVALPFFYFIYISITLAEENYLKDQFGPEYEDYLKSVNRFIPGNFQKWAESTKDMSFTWKRLIKKEHGTFAVVFSANTLFTILKLHYRYGMEMTSHISMALWIFFGAIGLFQIVSAIMKRRGMLEWESQRP